MDMTTFGTSAYMKLLALNSRPRDTEIHKRLWKTGGGGYDFHKAMRKIATEFAGQKADWISTRAKLKAITKTAERKSAIAATFALTRWVAGRQIQLLPEDPGIIVSSPNEKFSVKFYPDFEIELNGQPTRVHVWNTKNPPIRIREAIGTLGLFVSEHAPQSIAILSLRSNECFVPTDYESASALARYLALDIERRFSHIADEGSKRVAPKLSAERRAER